MALDKLVDSSQLNGALDLTADAIRAKTGGTDNLTWDMDTGFADAIGDIVAVEDLTERSSSDLTVNGATVTAPAGYYASDATKTIISGTITNNTTLPSGSSSSGTINPGSYIKIGAGYYDEAYYLAQGASGTLTIDTTNNAGTNINCAAYSNVNLTGINIPAGKSFSIKIPNGEGTITFTFTVDASGNTTVTES